MFWRMIASLLTPTTSRLASERSYARAQVDVDAFAAELLSYRNTASVDKIFVPSSSDGDSSRESSVVVTVSHA